MSASAPWHRQVARRRGSGGTSDPYDAINEIQHLFAAVVARPVEDLSTGCAGQHGNADIKPAPAPGSPDDRQPGTYEDHNLRLEY